MAKAATRAKSLLTALGVEHVVVIDDAVPDPSWFAIVALLEPQDRSEVGDEVGIDLLTGDWREGALLLDADRHKQIASAVFRVATDAGIEFPKAQSDPELKALQTLLASHKPRQLTPDQWVADADNVLAAAADQPTLIFIDQDLGDGRRGIDLVKKHLTDPPPGATFCMLTSEATPENEFEYWSATCDEANIPRTRLGVTAKAHLTDDQTAFVRMLKMSFTAGRVETIRDAVIGRARDSFESSFERLCDVDISVLTAMVFESSDTEGAWELDTIRRIMMAFVLDALDHGLLGDATLASAVHDVSEAATVSLGQDKRLSVAARQIQHYERYISGDPLATHRVALANGDLFEVTLDDGSSQQWMLAVQPCDIAIRRDGKRSLTSDQLSILPIESRSEPPRGSHVVLHHHDPDSEAEWYALLSQAAHVPTEILDLAAFSGDVAARWELNGDFAGTTVVGWKKRLMHVHETIRSAVQNDKTDDPNEQLLWAQALLPRSRIPALLPTVTAEVVEYPLRRIGRLRERHAETVLLAYGLAQSRTAEAHDLAKIRDN